MKNAVIALAVLCAAAPAFAAETAAPAAAPAAKPAFTTGETDLGTLMDNPATKAVLDKHMPGLTSNPQLQQARGLTLKSLQGFAPDQFSDAVLARIDADFAAIK